MHVDMRICGSCHTLVQVGASTTDCPRCSEALDPDSLSLLRRFIELGTVEQGRKGQVTVREAQKAASEILNRLDHANMKLALHHDGEGCPDCKENDV